MARAAVEVEGINRLARTLRAAGEDLGDLREAHRHAAQYVMPMAVSTSPARTYELRSTIRVSATPRAGVVKAGSRAAPYSEVVHYGDPHRNIRAQPWLTRAAQVTEPVWIGTYERELQQALLKVKGK